jgi:hypothetical protein
VKRRELTDTQAAVLDGLLRAEESGEFYDHFAVRGDTWRRLIDEGYVTKLLLYRLTDAGRAFARGWRKGQEEKRRCA